MAGLTLAEMEDGLRRPLIAERPPRGQIVRRYQLPSRIEEVIAGDEGLERRGAEGCIALEVGDARGRVVDEADPTVCVGDDDAVADIGEDSGEMHGGERWGRVGRFG